MKFWIKMSIALIVGIVAGAALEPGAKIIEAMRVVGTLFLNLLNFSVFPLLLLSGIRSVLHLKTRKRLSFILIRSLGYFVALTAIGASVGLIMGDLLKPGTGVNIKEIASPAHFDYPTTSQFLVDIIPDSIYDFINSGYAVLALLFISYLITIGIVLSRDDADPFHTLIISMDKTFHRLNLMILEFLPIGIFAYIGYSMGAVTAEKVMPYLKLLLIIVAGVFVQVFIVQALLVFFTTRLNPFVFLHSVISPGIVAYFSGNRYTAYPVLIETLEHNLGASREVVTFVTGLGTAFSLSGSAVATGVSTLFVAQAYGLDLSIYLQIIIVFFITVLTLKLDGIRGGTIVLLTVLLSRIVKLPDEGYALMLGISMVIDQIVSVADVTGNAAVSYIVSHKEGAVKPVNLKEFL